MHAVLEDVDWHQLTPEGYPYYRCCDICFGSAVEDALADKPVEDFRRFVFDHHEGLSVCEHCLEGYLKEMKGRTWTK